MFTTIQKLNVPDQISKSLGWTEWKDKEVIPLAYSPFSIPCFIVVKKSSLPSGCAFFILEPS